MKPQRAQPAWHAPAAAACFVLAVIAGLCGSLLTTNAIVNAHEHPTLYVVGLISLILALPIAILGAHCMDLMERQIKPFPERHELTAFPLYDSVTIVLATIRALPTSARKRRSPGA